MKKGDTNQLSKLQSQRRILGYKRMRQAAGLPEPTARQRELRRGRNERYRAKQNARNTEQQTDQQDAEKAA